MADNRAFVVIYRKSGGTASLECESLEVISRSRERGIPMEVLLTMYDGAKQRVNINPQEVEAIIISPADTTEQKQSSDAASSRSWRASPSLG